MIIAAVQMVSTAEVADNLRAAASLIEQAAGMGAQLLALPEYFPLIGASSRQRLLDAEDEGAGPIQEFLSDMARRHRLWIVGGSIPLKAANPEKTRNSALLFDDQGNRRARYDKIHLFNFSSGDEFYDENAHIEAGDQVCVGDTPCGRTGIAICYDLRFPELFRAMGKIDLLVVPAAFTATTGRAHWELLIRARAVENQCYVLAAAQGGLHAGGRSTFGHSMIVDPWGEILAKIDQGAGVITAQFDPERISQVRRNLPALEHRKL